MVVRRQIAVRKHGCIRPLIVNQRARRGACMSVCMHTGLLACVRACMPVCAHAAVNAEYSEMNLALRTHVSDTLHYFNRQGNPSTSFV